MQSGAIWFNLVQIGALWCNLVQIGATRCSLVQLGADWCNLVQISATWCRITKHTHCGHKWPQRLRSTDRSAADDDITTCNFASKCLIPKLLRVTVLWRYYGKVLSPFLLRYYAIMARSVLSPSFLLHYYGIIFTARYFTLLSYWHQSYCKSKCFILITLLRQGSSLFFLLSIKATVKSKCFILITLLRYYGKVLHSCFLLASKIL